MSPFPRRALLPLGLALCGRPVLAAPPLAVASFSILGDLVRQVAGQGVTLRVLAGPESDPHLFQPRPSDALALQGAALVLRNGLGFEPWLDRLLEAAGPRGPVVTASEGITPIEVGGVPDPHAWQDVRNAIAYTERIAAGLAAALPAGAAAWRDGAAA